MPTFDTPGPIVVTVELGVGDARITAGDRADTVVEVRPSDPGSDLDVRAAEQTRVEFTDGRLLVKAPKQRNLGLFGKSGSIDLELLLPAGSELHGEAAVAAFRSAGRLGATRIKTSTGDIRLEETGPADLHTASGAIEVRSITGPATVAATGELWLGTVDGDAVVKNSNGHSRITAVTGDLKARAANGDIVVGHAGANVTASSANGDVRIGEVTRGTVSLKTANGEVEAGIPAGTAAYLDLHTQFGTVHHRLDTAGPPEPGQQSVEVRARNSYGDIIIRRP